MAGIDIRAYRPDDREPLIALFRGSVRRVASRDYSPAQVLAWAPDVIDAEAFGLRRMAKPTFVATIGGAPARYTDLEPDGHIDMSYVHADHQGKGVARALLEHIERLARERRMNRLYSEVSITGRPAFERLGFRVLAAQTIAVRGQTFTNYRMEKSLN